MGAPRDWSTYEPTIVHVDNRRPPTCYVVRWGQRAWVIVECNLGVLGVSDGEGLILASRPYVRATQLADVCELADTPGAHFFRSKAAALRYIARTRELAELLEGQGA